jgi:pyrroline-5-carboxylate reductase
MDIFHGQTLAVIGAGNMGGALINGWLKAGLLAPAQLIAADPDPAKREALVGLGLRVTAENAEAARAATLLILSVKPHLVAEALSPEHCRHLSLVLSVAAGVTLASLGTATGNPRLVRAMPNTPAMVGRGMTAWTASPAVDAEGRAQAQALLGAVGAQIYVEREALLDAATALSGSGPAYVYLFLEALVDAGVHLGFSRSVATQLALETLRGAGEYAAQSPLPLAELRAQVTSPGGTTAEALYHMEKNGLRYAVARGVWAAYKRSVQLGGGTPHDPEA